MPPPSAATRSSSSPTPCAKPSRTRCTRSRPPASAPRPRSRRCARTMRRWPRTPSRSIAPRCVTRPRSPTAIASRPVSRRLRRPSTRPRLPRASRRIDYAVAREAPRPILDASAREGMLAEVESGPRRRDARAPRRGDPQGAGPRRRGAGRAARAAARARTRGSCRRGGAARRSSAGLSARSPPGSPDSCPRCWIRSIVRSAQARVELAVRRGRAHRRHGRTRRASTAGGVLRDRLAGLTESVHGLELQIHEKRLHVSSLLERVASELGLDEDILISEYGPDQAVSGRSTSRAKRPGAASVLRSGRSSAADCRMPSASSPSSVA